MKRIIKQGLMGLLLAAAVLLSPFSQTTVHAAPEQSQTPTYQIQVNRAANCVTVYGKDEMGAYTVPIRSFACSTAREGKETPLGVFTTSDYYPWRLMVDGTYGRWAVRFNGQILFHSVPYFTPNANDLEWDQYNLLGATASLGCVRMAEADVKWLYDNCERGTQVIVYEDAENPGPLGKPETMKVADNHPFCMWDPTDSSPENPWNTIKPSLYLTQDMGDGVLYMPVGATVEDLKLAVGLMNAQGLPYAPQDYELFINGNFDLNTFGVYRVWISGRDIAGVMVQQEMCLAVVYM